MTPSSKQNKTKVASSMKVLAKARISINEVAIFRLCELLANVDGLPAANELSLGIIW